VGEAVATSQSESVNIDWFVFVASVVLILAVCVPLVLYPDAGKAALDAGFQYVTQDLGVVYITVASAALVVLLVLAFGRYGDVKLGPPDSTPAYSTFSWTAMLFCGGIGSSVVYWGTIEWAYYYQAPPFDVAAQSGAALEWATAYPLFHWGITGWALYCLPGVAIAYAYHVGGMPSLRLSHACEPVLGRATDGPLGRLIDLTFMVGLIGATSTGLGLGVPLIGAILNQLTGVEETFALSCMIIVVITMIFAMSVYVGLDKGIKRLSNLNVAIALVMLLFVLVVGPTVYILETSMEAVGHVLQNFLKMSTYNDSQQTTSFVGDWTVFYWAWWLALGPFMGMFITKISRGRTIRELVVCALGYGTLGCISFFMVLGSYALYLQEENIVPVLQILSNDGAPKAIVAVLGALPLSNLVLPLFGVLCLIFAATSYDSASYTLASAATKSLPADAHPVAWHRMFWAFFLGILPVTLLYLGGLRSLQSAMVIISVPLLVVLLVLTFALFKGLRTRAAVEG